MIGAFFRAILSLRPFIKEVFIHSSEDMRRWWGRMAIILVFSAIVGYLVVDYAIDNHQSIVMENQRLNKLVEEYRLKLASCSTTTQNLSETAKKDGENYQTLLTQYRDNLKRTSVLERDLAQCTLESKETQHTIPSVPEQNGSKPSTPNRLRGLDP